MPKHRSEPPQSEVLDANSEKARVAFDAVITEIHHDHRMLEGKDLWDAVREVFAILRPRALFKEPK